MRLSLCYPGSAHGPGRASLGKSSHILCPGLQQEGIWTSPLVLLPRAEMLMVSALPVTSQLIQQGSWGKGKHMAVTSCIYNGLQVTMCLLAHQDHPACLLGIGKQKLVESWVAGTLKSIHSPQE